MSHELLLPKLVAGEFGSALDKVADGGGPKSGHESRRSFFRDDETPSREEAVARKSGIYLDACLHDIDCCQVPDASASRSEHDSSNVSMSAATSVRQSGVDWSKGRGGIWKGGMCVRMGVTS
jgi:hypothetical protein